MVLRSFLRDRLGLSHRTLATLKRREGGILLCGTPVTVRAVLHEGDELSLALCDKDGTDATELVPCPLPLDVLFEDEHICVCHKPSGMPTHPSFRHRDDTLANALAYYFRDVPYVFRAVNRLDKETSGVVLTAKTAFAAAKLSEAMQKGEIEKEYVAIVYGVPSEKGEIALRIRRRTESIILREVCDEGGDAALTHYERIKTDGERSLLRVRPVTGRTHQIRVHMAAIGHPIVGDTLYGTDTQSTRMALHAFRLVFPHPVSGERLSVSAPLPRDLLLCAPSLFEDGVSALL